MDQLLDQMGQRQLAARLLRAVDSADADDPAVFLETVSRMCRHLNDIRTRPIWHEDPSTVHESESDLEQCPDPVSEDDVTPDRDRDNDSEHDDPDGAVLPDPEQYEEISDTDSVQPHYLDISN